MGQQQSKEELLYQQVNYGNIEGIKSLCRDGANLEWVDRERKTALIVACMKPELYDVAKTLLELGANVNHYRPGRNGGTPLHHAAKRGLEHTVKLLLSHGANPLVINDDCQTPLDVARTKALTNVVRTIESHICLFAGWMREFYGPGILEVFAPQLLSRKLWVVVYPSGSRKPTRPFKLELAMYSNLQDSQPRSVIALWKANLEQPKFYHTDTSVIIVDSSNSTIPRGRRRRRISYASREGRFRARTCRQTRIKLAPGRENDNVQLQLFCNACKGIPQVMPPAFQRSSVQSPSGVSALTAPAAAAGEDMEFAMAVNAMHEIPTSPLSLSSGMLMDTTSGVASSSSSHGKGSIPLSVVDPTTHLVPPSAPPGDGVPDTIQVEEDGPIHYPTIDDNLDLVEKLSSTSCGMVGVVGKKEGEEDGVGTCVICLDSPVEGACIPCGHMAGCMSCLNEIKAKKWGCPVCRAQIDQVVRLYAV